MSYSVYGKFGLGKVRPTSITQQLADKTISKPRDKVGDVLIKAKNLIFLADFIVLDIPKDRDIPIILGLPFLATGRTLIDMEKCELIFDVEDKQEIFNNYTQYEQPSTSKVVIRNITSRNTQTNMDMERMRQISSLARNGLCFGWYCGGCVATVDFLLLALVVVEVVTVVVLIDDARGG
ncbi:uncharacterized protein LOC111392667 [Olea europaea var. sylvestris]|uniref:uncharacterized protein LOC111392667 n=1 Tax=Olea europaea var. sylvestris TaxID=158386 RepID=UPI000C1D8707|nr:uncharacterized protein LOC111392667 [Olea europaea var. sylvestris]